FASFNPAGDMVATAGGDFRGILWGLPGGGKAFPELRHGDQIQSIRFCRDGRWIGTASSDKSAGIWGALTGNPLAPPLRHLYQLTEADFLADGVHVVTRAGLRDSRIWKLPLDGQWMPDAPLFSRLIAADAFASSEDTPILERPLLLWAQL